MTGQGSVTNEVAAALRGAGWRVVFTCIPNAVHHGVVPISTPGGSARQRYPDVLSVRQGVTRLIEVETRLTAAVADNIALRLEEQVVALSDPDYWEVWRRHVEEIHELPMPSSFSPLRELVICGPNSNPDAARVQQLGRAGIWAGTLAEFEARLAS